MSSRNRYITPIEAINAIDPSITPSEIGNNYSFPVDETHVVTTIVNVEGDFERRARPFAETQTTEKHEGIERDFGYTVYLDNTDVLSFDPSEGDAFEIRTGSDSDDWKDISDDVTLDAERGVVEVDYFYLSGYAFYPFRPRDFNQRFRVTYRHGLDGVESGATSLNQQITSEDTAPLTVDVEDASLIPTGSEVLVSGDEYFYVTNRDVSNDTLTLGSRSTRGNNTHEHASGATISFVPNDVRSAIASKVAVRLLQSDSFTDILNEGGDATFDRASRIQFLEEEYERTVSRYNTNSGYV